MTAKILENFTLEDLQSVFDENFVGHIHNAYFSRYTKPDNQQGIFVAMVEQDYYPPAACELILTYNEAKNAYDCDFVQVMYNLLGQED